MLAQAANAVQLFEAGMLVCFGVSWPVRVLRTLRVRRVEGKSLAFMTLVFAGYVSGMTAKFIKAAGGSGLEWVTALYVFNAALVAVDIALYMRFRRRPVREAGLE